MNIKAVQKICYGVYIVSSKKDDKINGQIANVAFQITSEPPTIAISINKQNLTHEFIEASKVFSLSILSIEATMALIGRFGFKSGREIDKFKDTAHRIGATGTPVVLENTSGFVECEVLSSTDVGTHTIFIGKVVESEVLSDAEPMTYAYYHQIKGGKSPKTAPTYIQEEGELIKTTTSGKYKCKICGYIYDPATGDSEGGIKPGTSFEDLPDGWTCPICNAPKSEFEKEK
jgi:flavin reductase (DIM6/NTAB) family NADH-FMN oxidoreductase RutF/rubredoxin